MPYRVVCKWCQKEFTTAFHPRNRQFPKYCSNECKGLGRTVRYKGEFSGIPDRLVAWAAGIFEGEGSIATRPYVTAFPITGNSRVIVTQKDPCILLKLKALFGGKVRKRTDREEHDWELGGEYARAFVNSIYGYLSSRRQAQVMRLFPEVF